MRDQNLWATGYAHPKPWDQRYPAMTVPEMLAGAVARVPHAPMIDFMGRTYGYAEVLDGARRVAAGLHAMGVVRGDRIGLFLPNVPHYVAAYYGALMLGAVVVNFSPLYSVEELAHQVEDSGTRVLFTLSATALLPTAVKVLAASGLERLVVGSIAGVLPPAKSLLYRLLKRKEVAARPDDARITTFSALIANDGRFPEPAMDAARDVALIQYTGGTTGSPKGAMLTHQNLTANARQIIDVDPEAGAPDRIVGALPLFHIFANACVLNRTVANGGTMVLLPRFDAAAVLAAVERTKATSLPGVPTMYQALMDHPKLATTDLSSLRVCISGGAPLAGPVKARFEAATGAVLVEGYGLTESGIAATNPYEGLAKTGTIGQPLPATTIRLVDREDATRDAPPGEPGEIVIHGPQVMVGYWNRPDLGPEQDGATFAGGGLRTGDVGVIDEDGYVRIVDRLKDMISVGGFKVFPSRVETVLYRHDAVRDAIVIGVPDAYQGERPKAFVTLMEGAGVTGDELMAWLNPLVGKHERCVAVEVRDVLPRTLVGKLSRKELVAEELAKAG
ncbi:long-chain-fatty-acid--CoA ligase [Sphingomonas montana]|uniref:long-chain-fatty-acid--CoA ligase n=1 Tax=Sphingomonas montana TaxID=1843236 RepID=UPI00096D2998|nr:long-chain fatty acid--CoA ligase [Sphingomonas montana]